MADKADKESKDTAEKTPKKSAAKESGAKEADGGRFTVPLKGFLVKSRLPSKDCLRAILPLNDSGRKIGNESVQLLTSYFINKIGSLSRRYYTEIGRMSHQLGTGVYFLPAWNVDKFQKLRDELRVEFEEHEADIREFLEKGTIPARVQSNVRAKVDPDYIVVVRAYLTARGVQFLPRVDIAGRFHASLYPMSFDLTGLEEYVEEKDRERITAEIARARDEIVSEAVKDVEAKVDEFAKKVEEVVTEDVSAKMTTALHRDLQNLEKMAYTPGLSERCKALRRIIENPTEYVSAQKKHQSGRAKALAKVAGKR